MASSSSSSYDELEEYQNAEEAYIKSMGNTEVWIMRQSASKDSNYAVVNTWAKYKKMWAWRQPISSADQIQYERRGLHVTSKWFMARDPELREGDRIRTYDGVVYVVRGTINQAGLGRLWRVDTEQVTNAFDISVLSSSSSSSSLSSGSSSSSSSQLKSSSSSSSSLISSSSSSLSSSSSSSSSGFDSLLALASIVGDDLAATNKADIGSRQSIFSVDEMRVTNAIRSSNFYTANQTSGFAVNSSATANNQTSAIVRLQTTTGSAALRAFFSASGWHKIGLNGVWTFSVKIKSNDSSTYSGTINVQDALTSTVVATEAFSVDDSGWQTITATGETGGGSAGCSVNITCDENSDVLVTEPQIVRSQLPSANGFPAGAPELATTIDKVSSGGVVFVSALAGAIRLFDSKNWYTENSATGWDDVIGNGLTVTQEDDRTVRVVADDSEERGHRMLYAAKAGDSTYTFAIQVKSGTTSDQSGLITLGVSASDTSVAESRFTATQEWQWVYVTDTTTAGSVEFRIYNNTDTNILYRDPTPCEFSAKPAGFVENEVASGAYLADEIACTPSWGAAGTIVQAILPEGYIGSNNPIDSTAIFFTAGNINAHTPGSVTLDVNGTPLDTAGSVGSTAAVFFCDWNGTTVGAQFNEGARNTTPSATVPTGNLVVGDDTKPPHARIATLVFDFVLSDAERTTLMNGLQADMPTIDYRSIPMGCFGDSLTAGAGATVSYTEAMEAYNEKYSMRNRGVGGYTATQIATAANASGYCIDGADFMILWDEGGDTATQITQFNSVLAAKNPVTHFVVIGQCNTSAGTPANNATLLAEYGAANFVDVLQALIDASGDSTYAIYRSDAVHLNDAGYAIVAQEVAAKVAALIGA